MEESSNQIEQLNNLLDDQDTFLVKLPNSLKYLISEPDVFENIAGSMHIDHQKNNFGKTNPEDLFGDNKANSSLEFVMHLNLLEKQKEVYFDVSMPSLREIKELK